MTGRDELPHGRVTDEGSIRVVTKNVWTEQDSDWLGALLPLLRVCILVIRTDYKLNMLLSRSARGPRAPEICLAIICMSSWHRVI